MKITLATLITRCRPLLLVGATLLALLTGCNPGGGDGGGPY